MSTNEPIAEPNAAEDKIIWRTELRQMLDNVSSETIRVWMKKGKLPRPDTQLSARTMGWRRSTLVKAGIAL
ncbi:MAG: hypothetical protein LCH79_16610 [Proteobacteria bacterium]|nr:hypothetical protein [Pseudomonadota bacterium]